MRLAHWVVTLPAVIVLTVFAVANLQDVTLWPLPLSLPLGLVIVAALVLGFAAGELASWIGGRTRRREARHRARRITALEHELAATQAQFGGVPQGVVSQGVASQGVVSQGVVSQGIATPPAR